MKYLVVTYPKELKSEATYLMSLLGFTGDILWWGEGPREEPDSFLVVTPVAEGRMPILQFAELLGQGEYAKIFRNQRASKILSI